MPQPIVTVFGSGVAPRGEPLYEDAYHLGRAIAEAGWTLCNGGYGGTMEAGARGAREASGHVIGVTCETLRGRGEPNPSIVQEIPTFDLFQRVNTLMRLAHAYVVLPGGTGSLLELAAVWEFMNKGFLSRARPIVLYGDFWRPVVETVIIQQPDAARPHIAQTIDEVVAHLQGWLQNAD